VTDIDKARQLAEAKGIGYQTLIEVLLHDALKREERKRREKRRECGSPGLVSGSCENWG